MANGLDIGTLSGRIELEDRLTSVIESLTGKVDQFDAHFGSMGKHVAEQASSFFIAEAALHAVEKAADLAIDVFKDMVLEGGAIASVSENFEHLTSSAGRLSSTLLNELKAGTQGTVTDFELIKVANQDLAAGMNLTDKQFRTLADGAFALSQATGVDVKEALDTMNDAMLTGRTRGVAMLTGKIDLTAAEERFAESLGSTADRLNSEGKLQAARIAILESVGKATDRLGEQNLSLSDKVQQLMTDWNNFYEEVAASIATSPSIIHAFDEIKKALVEAFGGSTTSMLETVTGWINHVADAVAIYGPAVVRGIVDIKDWFVNLYHSVVEGWNALPDWFKNVVEKTALTTAGLVILDAGIGATTSTIQDMIGVAGNLTTTFTGIPKLIEAVGGGFKQMGILWAALDFSSLADIGASFSMMGTAAATALGPIGLVAVAIGAVFAAYELGKTEAVSGFFEKLGLELQGYTGAEADAAIAARNLQMAQAAAGQEAYKLSEAERKAKEAAIEKANADKIAMAAAIERSNEMKLATVEHQLANAEEQKAQFLVKQTTEEIKKKREAMAELAATGKGWEGTLATMNADMIAAIKGYLEAGVAQGTLATAYSVTATQVAAVASALKEEQEQMKLEAKQVNDSVQRWAEYSAKVIELSGSMTEKTIADIDTWKSEQIKAHVAAKTDTEDFYNWLAARESQMYQEADQKRLEADEHSAAHFQKVARDARDAYDFATDHADQFTEQYIADLAKTAQAAENAAQNWRSSLGGALKDLSKMVQSLSGEWMSLEQYAAKQSAGFSYTGAPITQFDIDTTKGGADTLLDELFKLQKDLPGMQKNVHDFASSNAYTQAQLRYNLLKDAYVMLKAQAKAKHPALPSFSEGGIGDFGDGTLAMLHGNEAIIPLDKHNGALGGVVNYIYVNGTAAEVARKVADEIMRTAKRQKQFGSA